MGTTGLPELKRMQRFLILAEELNFHTAARRLFVSQPALSQDIGALEKQLGVKLLERNPVRLTPEGSAFAERARACVAGATGAAEAATLAGQGQHGNLKIGCTAFGFPAAGVRRFVQETPHVKLHLKEALSAEQTEMLLRRELDVALVRSPVHHPDLHARGIAREDLMLMLPDDHPLAAMDTVRASDLRGEPLVVIPRQIGAGTRDLVLGWCLAHHVNPMVAQEAMMVQNVVGMLQARLGVSFAPAGMREWISGGITFRPLEPDPPVLELAAAWRRDDRSPLIQHFLSMIGDDDHAGT
jgi:DNA-binding transcriptional LysR family regulator